MERPGVCQAYIRSPVKTIFLSVRAKHNIWSDKIKINLNMEYDIMQKNIPSWLWKNYICAKSRPLNCNSFEQTYKAMFASRDSLVYSVVCLFSLFFSKLDFSPSINGSIVSVVQCTV